MKTMLAVTGILMSVLAGCGDKTNFNEKSKDSSAERQEPSDRELVEVAAKFSNEDGSASFSLADASKFRINVEGCKSGRSVVLTEADSDASLWLWDEGCVGKLVSFSVFGVDYTIQTPFTSYEKNGTATFKGTDETILTVKVNKQIAPDLAPNKIDRSVCQEVEYTFNNIEKGTGKSITPLPVGVKGKVIGEKLPAMNIEQATLTRLVSGVGEFDFKVMCASATDALCQDLIARDKSAAGPVIEYLLIKDTFGGTLTLAQAAALPWNTAKTEKQSYFGVSGFLTKPLLGPGPIEPAANRQMLLVLRVSGSFIYFEIDVNNLPDVQCQGPACPPPTSCNSHCPI